MKKKNSPSKRYDKPIRSRLTGTVLIPSVTLLVMWTAVSLYFVFDGVYARQVALGVREVSIPAVTGLASAQKERELSLAYMANPSGGSSTMYEQQRRTDDALTTMNRAAGPVLANAPEPVRQNMVDLQQYIRQLPELRSRIASNTVTRGQVNDYYNNLLNSAARLFDVQARIVPDVNATQGGIAATSVFRAADLMSRESSLVSSALSSGNLTPDDHLELARVAGAYHSALSQTAPFLQPEALQIYQRLEASDSWKRLVEAEQTLIKHGSFTAEETPPSVDLASWQRWSSDVSKELNTMTVRQADLISAKALSAGDSRLLVAVLGSVVALLASIASILVAVRVSRTLVDRALVTRLERLRNESLDIARHRLPDIVRRLRSGESVDVSVELPRLEHGQDEIGGVVEAFNIAQHTAVSAAVSEANARNGAHKVFLGIAHRNQGLVHRQLKILDEMERREEDSAQLDGLFQLDHLATRARRTTENLIILGGKQPGRRWRKPVRLMDALRAAAAETEQYHRVRVESVPDVGIHGSSVADTIHLISELIDNATSFSPPDSQVHVSSTQVARGVVVEIADQGLGMKDNVRERANDMMVNPPDFDAMALNADSSLGLFVVARLAVRLDIKVMFDVSRYGGTRATVLIPSQILATGTQFDDERDASLETVGRGFEVDSSNSTERIDDTAVVPVINGSEVDQPRVAEPPAEERPAFEPPPARTSEFVMSGSIDVSEPLEQPAVSGNGAQPTAPAEPQEKSASEGRPPLPRRQPQQSLVPQLCDDPDLDSADDKSIRESTKTISAFQKGSRKGRQADESTDS